MEPGMWGTVALLIMGSALTTLGVLVLFQRWVLKPYLDQKLIEIREISATVEQRVAEGVRDGLRKSLRELPEATLKDTSRQVAKMGSEFLENGLGAILGKYPGGVDGRRPRD